MSSFIMVPPSEALPPGETRLRFAHSVRFADGSSVINTANAADVRGQEIVQRDWYVMREHRSPGSDGYRAVMRESLMTLQITRDGATLLFSKPSKNPTGKIPSDADEVKLATIGLSTPAVDVAAFLGDMVRCYRPSMRGQFAHERALHPDQAACG